MTSPLSVPRAPLPPDLGPSRRALQPPSGTRPVALLGAAGAVLAVVLLAAHCLFWYRAVALRGGPDAYARGLDFTATLTGALIVGEGHGASLYDLDVQRDAQVRVMAPILNLRDGALLPYIHPPFEAAAFAPLMGLPYGVLYGLWTLGMLGALGASLWLLRGAAPLAGRAGWLAVLLACSYSPLQQALWLGQSTPLVLLGLCGAFAALRARREGLAGAALALVALKPQMLLVVGLVLLFRGRWRTLGTCAAFLGAVSVAAMPVLGALWPLRYVSFLATMSRWAGQHFEYPYAMYNWRGFAINTLGNWSPALVAPLVALLTLAVVGLAAWACWRGRAAAAPGGFSAGDDLRWAAACLAGILIAPHLYVHDLLLLILPAWIVAARLIAPGGPFAGRWAATLAAGYGLGIFALVRTEEQLGAAIVLTVALIALTVVALLVGSLGADGGVGRARRGGTAAVGV